jgi:hypothetical protein
MLKKIELGTYLEWIIKVVTFNTGDKIALFIAKKLFNKNTCGCCERKQWLNRLTNKEYTANCGSIKLWENWEA